MKFVRPTSIPIRQAWPREDTDFTPWLAENLDYLEDTALGYLEVLKTEVTIPGFKRKLDLLAQTHDERRVAIENQYRATDHDHLTRGLAYAVGLNAVALVVIAEDHGDEFIAVADYLNRAAEAIGDDGIPVFLITLRVEKVGEYLIPRFEIQARPNQWRAEVRHSAAERDISERGTERRTQLRQFWTEFLAITKTSQLQVFANLAAPDRSDISAPAISGVNIVWSVRVRRHDAYPLLWIDTGSSGTSLQMLNELRDRVGDVELGFEIEWQPKEHAQSCNVAGQVVESCGYETPQPDRKSQMHLLVDRMAQLKAALDPHLSAAYHAAMVDTSTE